MRTRHSMHPHVLRLQQHCPLDDSMSLMVNLPVKETLPQGQALAPPLLELCPLQVLGSCDTQAIPA